MNLTEEAKVETRHTPGPWEISPEGNVWSPNAGHAIIAKVGENKRPCSEHGANARLIAAAPELLEACRAALDNIPFAHSTLIDLDAVCKVCEKAIAKAEGT